MDHEPLTRIEEGFEAARHAEDHGAHDEARPADAGEAAAEGRIEGEFVSGVKGAGKKDDLEPAGDGRGDGDADGAEDHEQHQGEADIGGHADAGIEHRRLGVLAGEETGMEHLDQDKGRKAGCERGEHGGGRLRVDRAEGAVLEQDADDRTGGDEQRHRRRQGQQQRGFERAVLGFHGRGVIVLAEAAAELRQQHDADGDADDAERKLEQAVGVIEPGHDAILKRGDHGVEDDGDLAHAAGDECRRGERQ